MIILISSVSSCRIVKFQLVSPSIKCLVKIQQTVF